jgi:DnaJ-domain-containing protein 1
MFERGVFPSGEKAKLPLRLRLRDGATLSVQVAAQPGARLIDLLNRPEPFLEVEEPDGRSRIIAKGTIAEIEPLSAPKADQLAGAKAAFDPHAILGVPRGAGPEEIRARYIEGVKRYHPDRFNGLDLPSEMRDYAAAMIQRINAAYQALAPRQAA